MVKPHSSIVCSSRPPPTSSRRRRLFIDGILKAKLGRIIRAAKFSKAKQHLAPHGRSSCTKKKKKKMMMMMVMLMHLTSFWARIQLKFFCLTWPPMALYSDDTFDSTWPSKIIKMSHYAHFPQRENIIRLCWVPTLSDATRRSPTLPDPTRHDSFIESGFCC